MATSLAADVAEAAALVALVAAAVADAVALVSADCALVRKSGSKTDVKMPCADTVNP